MKVCAENDQFQKYDILFAHIDVEDGEEVNSGNDECVLEPIVHVIGTLGRSTTASESLIIFPTCSFIDVHTIYRETQHLSVTIASQIHVIANHGILPAIMPAEAYPDKAFTKKLEQPTGTQKPYSGSGSFVQRQLAIEHVPIDKLIAISKTSAQFASWPQS